MKWDRKTRWSVCLLHCLLAAGLVDASFLSYPAHFLSVSSKVGNQAVLPCSWKQRLGAAAPPACHVQWTTPVDTVFEQRGEDRWQAEEFEGRVEVPEEKLENGDCSLIIRDVQIGDTGTYDSFMVVDGVRAKTRVFIQSVKLSVYDHKSLQSRGPGEDLVLDLYTRHSVSVVFLGRNSSEWSVLWTREDETSERLHKHPLNEQLTLQTLQRSDEGTYKVLDERGLAVSTVQLSVDDPTALKVQQTLEEPELTDVAARSSCSALLILSVLSFLHLL